MIAALADHSNPNDPRVRHSNRFGKVSNRYALQVTRAYGGDIEQVARDTDEQVAARVAEWERAQGMEPRDWVAWGRREEGKGEG